MKLSVNRASTIFGLAYWVYQGFMRIDQLIIELLTTVIPNTITYNRKNTDSKLIDITSCTACKHVLLVVENTILIRYYWQTAKTRALCESIDGPAGRPTDNPPNSDWLGVYHRTVPKLMFWVNWQPRRPISQRFGSDTDTDPKWWSRTVGNTVHRTSSKTQVQESRQLVD
jgi:hypothetical protein